MASTCFRTVEHVVECAHTREYVHATVNGDNDRPRLAVKQYIPLDNPEPKTGDITVIGAHANAFPKELYEPLFEDLHGRLAAKGIRIRSAWIADMWNQNHSGILNEDILGNDPSWYDHSRDLLHLINSKQDAIQHPIVGIGHSMGGTQLTLLSLMHPRLFDSLILIDPVIQLANAGIAYATLSTRRRDIWKTKEDAVTRFRSNPMYKSWDPRVLDRWVEFGLRPTPTALYPEAGHVTLSTTKHQELFVYLRPSYRDESGETIVDNDPTTQAMYPGYQFYRPEPVTAFQKLPALRPSVLYLFGRDSELATPDLMEAKMTQTGTGLGGSGGAAVGRVRHSILDCGHLVAMEKPTESANAIATFLALEMERQREQHDKVLRKWKSRSRKEQMTIDEAWPDRVKLQTKTAEKL